MPPPFDPYQYWFGISPDERPITYYRLLGTVPFEPASQKIAAARDRRLESIEPFRKGQLAAIAERVVGELNRAAACLLDPQSKARYDQKLRAKLSAVKAVAPQPSPGPNVKRSSSARQVKAPPGPAPSAQSAGLSTSGKSPASATAPRRKQFFGRIPVGALVLTMSVAILIMGAVIGWMMRGSPAEVAVVALEPSSTDDQARPEIPEYDPPEPVEADIVRPDPPPLEGETLEESSEPVAKPDDVERPPPPRAKPDQAGAFDVPAAIDLPGRSEHEPVRLAEISAADVVIDLKNPPGNPRQFQIEPEEDSWTISSRGSQVARLMRRDHRIEFAWTSDASADAECLRNTALAFRAAGSERPMALRTPRTATPITIDLTKTTITETLDVELWGLDPQSLVFECIEIEKSPTKAVLDPTDARVDFGETLRVIFRDQFPAAMLECGLFRAQKGPAVQVRPVTADTNGKSRSWTKRTVNGVATQLKSGIRAAENGIASAPRIEREIQDSIASLNRSRNELTQAQVEFQIQALQGDLAALHQNVQAWRTELPILRDRLTALVPLGELGNAVHNTSNLRYRVYFVADGHEVEIVKVS